MFAQLHPERVITLSALSVPHPAAFVAALVSTRQFLSSWYLFAFQTPGLPERLLLGSDGTARPFTRFLQHHQQTPDVASRDARAMTGPRELTAALNWYRATVFADVKRVFAKTQIPTMYVWGDRDIFIREGSARKCGRHIAAPYRFEVLSNVTHWVLDDEPDSVAALLIDWFAEHSD